ncbi:MAG: 4Fe-4S binding protein [Candidatus Helarchaeota archaeon]|nr:4Fe-4S binding protein [Candidatus Helarchaeota archaeon]
MTESDIETTMDVLENQDIILKWKSPNLEKELIYFTNKCTGCGICPTICPTKAIELGPVHEIATALESREAQPMAPYVLFDLEKCVFCGLCAILCPVNAIDFKFNELSIKKMPEYPKLDFKITLDEEPCIPCRYCELICPVDAIKTDLKLQRKDDVVKYPGKKRGEIPEDLSGSIKIDEKKCVYCMLCMDFCDAVEIDEALTEPNRPYPGKNLRINEKKCDYCGLCAKICPTEVFKITCDSKVKRTIKDPKIEGEAVIDEDKCIACGWCVLCPVEAIKLEKFFEGKITLQKLDKCDPSGCKACIKICPSNAWYLPKDPKEKIAVNDDLCLYCGSCELSCPYDCIKLERTKINYTGGDLTQPWINKWKNAFLSLIGKVISEIKLKTIPVKIEEIEKIVKEKREIPLVPEEIKSEYLKRLIKIRELLNKVKTRYWVEGRIKKRPLQD